MIKLLAIVALFALCFSSTEVTLEQPMKAHMMRMERPSVVRLLEGELISNNSSSTNGTASKNSTEVQDKSFWGSCIGSLAMILFAEFGDRVVFDKLTLIDLYNHVDVQHEAR